MKLLSQQETKNTEGRIPFLECVKRDSISGSVLQGTCESVKLMVSFYVCGA